MSTPLPGPDPSAPNRFEFLAALATTHRHALDAEAADAEATQRLAMELAPRFADGGSLLLLGPLGAGKTTFTQGLLKGLGYGGHPKSPSFVLQHVYKLAELTVEHWDLYRLDPGDESQLASVQHDLGAHGDLVIVEWPEALIRRGLHRGAHLLTIELAPDARPDIADTVPEVRRLTLWEPWAAPREQE
ncbi:MAG TPA: tRNA (adenosine(37)-N6)-threonylcarbamoyltransferase complex ATPase subunit type 1 TsaE [bacterium]|nr:tRNA (adenosine(37)-N6)-threonylcarbamoyltransferase complex ATPase subunit type 1 TsaE [bacterium]